MMKQIYTRSFQEKAERLIISNDEIQRQSINKKVAVRNHYKQKHKNGTQVNFTKGECKKNYQFLICSKVVSHWSPLGDVSFARTNTKSLLLARLSLAAQGMLVTQNHSMPYDLTLCYLVNLSVGLWAISPLLTGPHSHLLNGLLQNLLLPPQPMVESRNQLASAWELCLLSANS